MLATAFQVWRFENILAADQTMNGADRYYVPRVGHTTGEIDIHDISVLGDGRIVFVNTAYSCLSLLSPVHAFRLLWKPSFISNWRPRIAAISTASRSRTARRPL